MRWRSARRMRTTNAFSGVSGVSEVTRIGYVLGHDNDEARFDTYLGISNRPRNTPFVSVRTVVVRLDRPASIFWIIGKSSAQQAIACRSLICSANSVLSSSESSPTDTLAPVSSTLSPEKYVATSGRASLRNRSPVRSLAFGNKMHPRSGND